MDAVANLRKLADYIEANVEQGQLDMSWYRHNDDGYVTKFLNIDNCGTSGCALGWAPFVDGLEVVETDFTGRYLDFDVYGERIFPVIYHDCCNDHVDEVFGEFLSSSKPEVIQRLRDKADQLEDQQ